MVAGVRVAAARDLSTSAASLKFLTVEHTLFKSTRYITEFFLKCSRELHDPCKPCAALDFLAPTTSVATVSVQYLSSLCAGAGASDLRVVWDTFNFDSWFNLCEHDDDLAQLVQVGIYVVVGGIHRRFIAIRQRALNKMLLLAHPAVPLKTRKGHALWLLTKVLEDLHCCVGPFVFRLVHDNTVA